MPLLIWEVATAYLEDESKNKTNLSQSWSWGWSSGWAWQKKNSPQKRQNIKFCRWIGRNCLWYDLLENQCFLDWKKFFLFWHFGVGLGSAGGRGVALKVLQSQTWSQILLSYHGCQHPVGAAPDLKADASAAGPKKDNWLFRRIVCLSFYICLNVGSETWW